MNSTHAEPSALYKVALNEPDVAVENLRHAVDSDRDAGIGVAVGCRSLCDRRVVMIHDDGFADCVKSFV